MRIIESENYQMLSKKMCDIIINRVNSLPTSVLGLATGSTPELLYDLLVKANQNDEVSFAKTTTFNLDEYVGLSKNHPNSYSYYMNRKLFNHIDIEREKTFIPNGKANDLEVECLRYEELIEEVGGIDVQILGLGVNGHIGFNEPGTSFSTKTHTVELDLTTRKANSRFFENNDKVPNQAITMGINTILASKEIYLLVSGVKKADALKKLIYGDVSESFPASILQTHQNVTIVADKMALSGCRLTQEQ